MIQYMQQLNAEAQGGGKPTPFIALHAGQGIAPDWSYTQGFLPTSVTRWSSLIQMASKATGVPASLIGAVMATESSGHQNDISSTGAIGLMQLLPDTARDLGVNPWIPAQNILGGAEYLAQKTQQFGNWILGLYAYNEGPGTVEAYLSKYKNDPTSLISALYWYGIKSGQGDYVGKILQNLGLDITPSTTGADLQDLIAWYMVANLQQQTRQTGSRHPVFNGGFNLTWPNGVPVAPGP